MSSTKSRKKLLQELSKKADQDALLKKIAQEAEVESVDSSGFADKVFQKLLDSIKIEGLED